MIVKASIGFLNNETAPAVANQADIIIDAMTVAKGTFSNPVPSLAEVTAANAAEESEGHERRRTTFAIRRQKRLQFWGSGGSDTLEGNTNSAL